MTSNNKHFVVKYLECRHNYAARFNSHVLDGCGEFCPTVAHDETPESFICAACHCHRNFHRKVEVEVEAGVELPIFSINHPINDAPLAIIDGPPISPQRQYSTRPEQPHHRHQRFYKNNIVIIQPQGAEIEMGGGEVEVADQSNFKRNYNNASSSVRMKLKPNQKERVLAFAKDVMRWRWTKVDKGQ
ncbi:hypothetical protein P3S68_010123 [Capsicum galapagoense]